MKPTSLNVVSTLTEGITIGLKNAASLIVAAILYILTIWIPYLNVGTTIAMMTIPGKLANGEIISPLFIFEGRYRQDFSAFFLLQAFTTMVTMVGFAFMVIPAIVISISLSLATYILVDFDKSPTDAMKLSNQATNGHKWTIFGINVIFAILVVIASIIVGAIANILGDTLGTILMIVFVACIIPFALGISSVIYRTLYLEAIEETDDTPSEGVETL